MKLKKIIFTLLTGASLGFALPAHEAVHPANTSALSPSIPANSTAATIPLVTTPAANVNAADLQAGLQGSGIGKDCAAALLSIVTNPEFSKCVPLPALLPLAALADGSVIKNFIDDPYKNYKPLETPLLQSATLLCPAPKCSDSGVAGAIKSIQDSCKNDLQNPLIQLILFAATFYSPLRDSFCFQDGKQFCWDETINTALGLPKSPIEIVKNPLLDAVAVSGPTVMCNKCNKQIYNTFANFLKDNAPAKELLKQFKIDDKVLNEIVVFFAVKCGIKFEDGQVPKKR